MAKSPGLVEKTSEESVEKKWVNLMIKSAKKYHKLCPYYDKKTIQCLLMATVEGRAGKCDRDGKYDGCPIFTKFLEKLYKHYTMNKKTLPRDFQDVVNQIYIV
ncbi:MAG: hypothetical protein QXO93_06565 [Acidilobaceae archaeon]